MLLSSIRADHGVVRPAALLAERRERVVARVSARVSEEPVNLSVATMPETPPLTPEVTPYYPDV